MTQMEPADHTSNQDTPGATLDRPGVRLLLLLDALVHRDAPTPDFTGTVCLGVKSTQDEVYWHAVFAKDVETRFASQPLPNTDASLRMDPDTAESILATGALPAAPQVLEFGGNAPLMKQFLARYTSRRTPLDIRLGR